MTWFLQMHQATIGYFTGRWDEALALVAGLPEIEEAPHARASILVGTAIRMYIEAERGRAEEVARLLTVFAGLESSADVQEVTLATAVSATAARARGDHGAALGLVLEGLRRGTSLPLSHPNVRSMWLEAVESAVRLEDREAVEELVAMAGNLPQGILPPHTRASAARARARLAWWGDEHEAGERESRTAEGVFREIGAPFWLGVTLLERAEWLSRQGRHDEASAPLGEAQEIFGRLGATPWLERAKRLAPAVAEAVR